MTLNYLTGRVSNAEVGIPGFSTDRDLTLDISGAVGVDTSRGILRAQVDVPEISIRGELVDSNRQVGGIGYYLSKDIEGVTWVEVPPFESNAIFVFDDGQIVGLGSFTGLNFTNPDDPDFTTIVPNSGNPNIADISYDIRWVRRNYGNNKGISTGFGTDGTYASIPGFGTSEAVGVTSVGIGTDQPLDDFQVGVGSTGVTVNGPEGKVECVTLKAQNVEIDGNITVESLIVDPGIATFRGPIDAQGVATFSNDVFIGFASITESELGLSTITQADIFFGNIGTGSTSASALVVTGLSTFNGIVTTTDDLYVGNDLYVKGDTFFNQINAENIVVTGISTLNEVEGNNGIFTSFTVTGFTTLTDFSFNAGVGTYLNLEFLEVGLSTTSEALIGIATIGFASIRDADVTGVVTVTNIDVEEIDIERAFVGVLTVGEGFRVNGLSTFVGVTTFEDDVFIDGDLSVTGALEFEDLFGTNLLISGVGTINELVFNVGIGTSLRLETLEAGIGTFDVIVATAGTIGGVGFDSGKITADEIDADLGRIGILTGDQLNYGIATFTELSVDIGYIGILTGTSLFYYDNSFINGVVFGDEQLDINRNIDVSGASTFQGVGTFLGDLYVGNDLYVAGELIFEQLIGENLYITGIGTFNEIDIASGVATFIDFEGLNVSGVATIQDTSGVGATFVTLQADSQVVTGLATVNQQLSEFIGVGTIFIGDGFSDTFDTNSLIVNGIGTVSDLNFITGVGTFLKVVDLEIVGVATIQEIDVEEVDIERAFVGIATVGDLTVTGLSTFGGPVDINSTATIDQEVVGVSTISQVTIGSGVAGELEIGIATVGFATITTLEATSIDAFEANVGFQTVGFLTVTEGFNVTGVSTFVGFSTFSGDVYIDGDLTVTGVATYAQLNAEQSQIGILTVFTALDGSTAISSFRTLETIESALLQGVSTISGSEFNEGDALIARNVVIGGITTFEGVVNIEETSFVNQEVTGISTMNFADIGIGSAGRLDVTQLLEVTDSLFTGVASITTFEANLGIVTDLRVENLEFNVGVGSTLTVGEINVGIVSVGFASITDTITGVSTIGLAEINQLIANNSLFTGVSTFQGEVEVETNITVDGITSTANLVVTESAEVNELNVAIGTIVSFQSFDAQIDFARIGFNTSTILDTSDLRVTGPSTFSGDVWVTGNATIDGDLTVTGVVTFAQLDAEQSQIGILTVSQYLNVNDILQTPTGFSTFNDFSANVGVVTNLTAEIINAGILTTGDLNITGDLTVGRNLEVFGITTLGAPDPITGFTTTLGDLFVGGDLYVKDDIFYDEIVGRNLFISGIGTINTLLANLGIVTDLFVDNLNFNVGVGTTLGVQDFTALDIETVDLTVTNNLEVIGLSTFIGVATFNNDVGVDGSLFVQQDIRALGSLFGAEAVISGTVSGNVGVFTTGQFEFLNSEEFQTVDATVTGVATVNRAVLNFLEVGILTAAIINSTTIENVGLITTGTLYVDTLTNTNTLNVRDQSIFEGDGFFLQNVNITNDLGVGGTSTLLDFSARNGIIAGFTTATIVDIDGALDVTGAFNVTGIATFETGLRISGAPLIVDTQIFANQGFVTSIQGTDLQYETGNFTQSLIAQELTVNTNTLIGGVTTTSTLEVLGQASASLVNVSGALTAATGDFTALETDNLTFNIGIGTDLTLETLIVDTIDITDLNITGIATIAEADIPLQKSNTIWVRDAIVSNESVTQSALAEFTTTAVTPVNVNLLDDIAGDAFEITILAVEGTNLHSTKISAIQDGTNVFWNEYATVFNSTELATYSLDKTGVGANETRLIVTPASTSSTAFRVWFTGIGAPSGPPFP